MSRRSVIRSVAQLLFGLVAGALCGFAILTVSFIGLNAAPSSGTAWVVVLAAALVGAAAVSLRLWRQRPARPAAAEGVPAARPFDRPFVRLRTALRDWVGALRNRVGEAFVWLKTALRDRGRGIEADFGVADPVGAAASAPATQEKPEAATPASDLLPPRSPLLDVA